MKSGEYIYNFRYLSVSYFALVRFEEAELIANGVTSICWYPIDKIPQLAFDHQKIIEYGYSRLRNKLEYSPIAFDVYQQSLL